VSSNHTHMNEQGQRPLPGGEQRLLTSILLFPSVEQGRQLRESRGWRASARAEAARESSGGGGLLTRARSFSRPSTADFFFAVLNYYSRNESKHFFFLNLSLLSHANPSDMTYEGVAPVHLVQLKGLTRIRSPHWPR
jgi:hypothetical protein